MSEPTNQNIPMTPLTDQKLAEMKERASKAEPGDLVFIVTSKGDIPLLILGDRRRLAKKYGVSETAIGRLLNGRNLPNRSKRGGEVSDNEIRIAIAEIMIGPDLCQCGLHWMQSDKVSCGNAVPNYPHDLNAIHEAWSTLNDDQKKAFYRHLSNAEGMTRLVYKNVLTQDWLVVGATAHQRAEAFLRTIGKWKEPHPENEGAKSE